VFVYLVAHVDWLVGQQVVRYVSGIFVLVRVCPSF